MLITKKKIAHEAHLAKCKNALDDCVNGSITCFEYLPNCINDIEKTLDQTEVDFKEGAFAPFWDSVAQAACQLGSFDEDIERMSEFANAYLEWAKAYEETPPPYPIKQEAIEKIEAASRTLNQRMKDLVRQAQRNFHFASIYEQRKTNQLLISGFETLAEALNGIENQMLTSIADLGFKLRHMRESIVQSVEGLSDGLNQMQNQLQKADFERRERYDRALGMLDNIQRNRRPANPNFGYRFPD